MNYFLFKTDPDTYSIDDFEKDGKTIWDGVHNYQAINFIKTMKVGDKVYFYHSQSDKAILAIAEVSSLPFENKEDKRPSWAIEIKFIERLKTPVSLADLKAENAFKDFLLLRNPRLSIIPVPENVIKFIDSRQK
jgi:predicted RNA-binding protein with PUA-like domain